MKKAHNNWSLYRPGDRLSPEADDMLYRMARNRVRGLIPCAEWSAATLANLLESAYMQGFEDAGVAAIKVAGHEAFEQPHLIATECNGGGKES